MSWRRNPDSLRELVQVKTYVLALLWAVALGGGFVLLAVALDG